ncbi:hypothetical protein B0H67DRAFT_605233 [Lasiosphaeris hirsuta]|uniref:DUF7580 domain-containing protein n=1 Tax=Lasiosphaeris hirsuta TaxID=260670 RepID=A0AA40B9L4_9PEZI|nr:hypothetical protein B0H67DRAFT_605233 [Lasiosphaeris hirsuta]
MSQQISSLCASLALPAGSCAGYLTANDCRYYVYPLAHRRQNMNGTEPLRSITLDQILRGGGDTYFPPPTRSRRYALSLTMASSSLQLLDSPWVPSISAFSKTNVHFPSDPSNTSVSLLDQQHITTDLGADHQLHATTPSHPDPSAKSSESLPTTTPATFTDALDHLGILLLELCFGSSLESQPSRML